MPRCWIAKSFIPFPPTMPRQRIHSLTTSATGSTWGMGPSTESTSSRTPSTIFSTRSTSPPKSAWPGVSMMLILLPWGSPHYQAYFFPYPRVVLASWYAHRAGRWRIGLALRCWTGIPCGKHGTPCTHHIYPLCNEKITLSGSFLANLHNFDRSHAMQFVYCQRVKVKRARRTLYRTAVFLDRMVMPRSRSRSLESMMRSATFWLSLNTWQHAAHVQNHWSRDKHTHTSQHAQTAGLQR